MGISESFYFASVYSNKSEQLPMSDNIIFSNKNTCSIYKTNDESFTLPLLRTNVSMDVLLIFWSHLCYIFWLFKENCTHYKIVLLSVVTPLNTSGIQIFILTLETTDTLLDPLTVIDQYCYLSQYSQLGGIA